MTQNTEQNVRTQDEQVKVFGDMVEELGSVADNSYGWARREIEIAEARGAAEQRRKDVEGQEPFATAVWYKDNRNKCPEFVSWNDAPFQPYGQTISLYTRPTNVAALEARIAELEAALSSVRDAIENADPAVLGCTLWMLKGAETVCDFINAALTREGEV